MLCLTSAAKDFNGGSAAAFCIVIDKDARNRVSPRLQFLLFVCFSSASQRFEIDADILFLLLVEPHLMPQRRLPELIFPLRQRRRRRSAAVAPACREGRAAHRRRRLVEFASRRAGRRPRGPQ